VTTCSARCRWRTALGPAGFYDRADPISSAPHARRQISTCY